MRKCVLEEQRIDSFEEWIQFAVGSTTDLDTILSNLSTDEIKEEVRLYAIKVAKQYLINASENAYLLDCSMQIKCKYGHGFVVDKESILSENNIPKLD